MNREEIIKQGMRLLKDVHEDEHFRTVDGRTLRSVRELVLLLETYHDDHFRHHVNEHRNDFASWIEHSVGDHELADRIRSADSQQAIQKTISDRLEELESKLLSIEHGETPIEPENAEPDEDFTTEELEGISPEAEVSRDDLLDEIEKAIAQAQAQMKIERAQEVQETAIESPEPTDLTGEPDLSPAEKKLERKAAREQNASEKNGFSFGDFFMGFIFGAVIGGVAAALIVLLL